MTGESSDHQQLGFIKTGHTDEGHVALMIPAAFLGFIVNTVESARLIANSILHSAELAEKIKREIAERN